MRMLSTIILAALLFMGCKTTADPAETPDAERTEMQVVDGIKATVKYIDLEGGFYGIETDAGDNYLAINLEEAYKVDGLRILFTMKPRTDIMSTKMWGKIVEITEISKL
ncbi:MAG: hypothetical protein AB8G77_11355 [Rhodothermales bacterium]